MALWWGEIGQTEGPPPHKERSLSLDILLVQRFPNWVVSVGVQIFKLFFLCHWCVSLAVTVIKIFDHYSDVLHQRTLNGLMPYSIFGKLCWLLRWERQHHFYFLLPPGPGAKHVISLSSQALWQLPLLKPPPAKLEATCQKNNDLWFP